MKLRLPPRVDANPKKRDSRLANFEPALLSGLRKNRRFKRFLFAFVTSTLFVVFFVLLYLVLKLHNLPWRVATLQ